MIGVQYWLIACEPVCLIAWKWGIAEVCLSNQVHFYSNQRYCCYSHCFHNFQAMSLADVYDTTTYAFCYGVPPSQACCCYHEQTMWLWRIGGKDLLSSSITQYCRNIDRPIIRQRILARSLVRKKITVTNHSMSNNFCIAPLINFFSLYIVTMAFSVQACYMPGIMQRS